MRSHLYLLAILCLLPILSKCSEQKIYTQHELAEEILSARPGHDGKLTNQACLVYQGNVCTSWSVKEYDITDVNVRKELNTLNFVCKISGKRYKVCLDQPGFCRMSYTKNCLWFLCGDPTLHTDYIPIAPYQAVLDSGVKCFNQAKYGFEEIQ